jgi:hypothetical protein
MNNLIVGGAGKVTCSKFCTEDPPILGATLKKLVAKANWGSGFM